MREVSQGTPHGLGEQIGEVIDGGRLLDRASGQDVLVGMAEDDSPPHAAVLGIRSNLEGQGPEFAFGWGEILTFVSTWFFALVIVFLDRFGRGVESAHFTVAFLAGTGLPALGIVAAMTAARSETAAWQEHSNAKQRGVDWQFRVDDARVKLKSVYPKIML